MIIKRRISWPTVRSHTLWLAGYITLVGATQLRASNPTMSVLRIDGATLHGQWISIAEAQSLSMRDGDATIEIPLGEIQRITFHRNRASEDKENKKETGEIATAEVTTVTLNDGGSLIARSIKGEENGLMLGTKFHDEMRVPLNHIAGVRFTQDPRYATAYEQYKQALLNRRPAEDVIISRDETDPKDLRGRVERFTEDGVDFRFSDKSRTAKFDRLLGVVLATGGVTTKAPQAFIDLMDGSAIGGRITRADTKSIEMETAFSAGVSFALSSVQSIALTSDLVVFLSDLPIADEHTEGLLHRPWPVRIDRNLRGDPILIGGRQFERGISCHSKTELTYELDEPFQALAATLGLDNYVRPRGSVVYRVLGDGRTLFDSGPVTGRDEPRDILVKIEGIRSLTLIVDYGEGLDLSDHADWGGVRLIRPANDTGVQ